MKFIIFIGPFLFLQVVKSQHSDATLQPNAKGQDVVDAVIYKLDRSKIFKADNRFLFRMAWVETQFGVNDSFYQNGGIWQIQEHLFNQTKNTTVSPPDLATKITNVKRYFDIDWLKVKFDDCLKPLYSAIAVQLHLLRLGAVFPNTIKNQARLWYQNFEQMNGGNRNEQFFIDKVKQLEETSDCGARIDIVVVLDSSGSIGENNFVKAKASVAELLMKFDLNTTRMGYVVYSTNIKTYFEFSQTFTNSAQLGKEIKKVSYTGGMTSTDKGIDGAVDIFKKHESTNGKVMVVFTDGGSDSFTLTGLAADRAIAENITNFAVGIGTGVNQGELLRIAGNETKYVINTGSYDTLIELVYQLNSDACKIPATPELNDTIEETVGKDEKRYYVFEVPAEGITIHVTIEDGDVTVYYSYEYENPSAAMNDGSFNETAFIPPRKNGALTIINSSAYIAVQGLKENNQFFLKGEKGNNVPTTTPKTLITKTTGQNGGNKSATSISFIPIILLITKYL